jgi:RPM1-interacting protein 4
LKLLHDSKSEKGSALPKFGEWDEKGPSAADTYTRIFDRVREDKQIGLGQQPATTNKLANPNYSKQFDSYQPSVCYPGSICFTISQNSSGAGALSD